MPRTASQYEPFPSWYRDAESILMLDFGYDESGDKNTLLVSCQIGKVHRLRRFSRKWREILKDAGVEYFHAVDYDNHSRGPFKGLNRKDRSRLLGKLSRLIHEFMDIGLTARIDTRLYKSETTPAFRSKWGSAYCYAVQTTVLVAHLYLQAHQKTDGANILLENGHRNVGDVIDRLNGLKKEEQHLSVYIKSCGGGWKKDHPVLQAADMLAYSEWQAMNQSGREMFDALNPKGSRYRPIIFDCSKELIAATKKGVESFLASRKAFWESRRKRRIES